MWSDDAEPDLSRLREWIEGLADPTEYIALIKQAARDGRVHVLRRSLTAAEMRPASADGVEVGHLAVQASQLEQALRHAHRLTQRQVEQVLDRQAELNRRLAVGNDGQRAQLKLAEK